MNKPVKTLCPYCGVGCGLIATTDGKRILSVRGDPDHPANHGKLCLKGASVAHTVHVPNRLRFPIIADKLGRPRVVPAEGAIQFVAERLSKILQTHGPDSLGFYVSGQLTTEAQYFFNKFAKGTLRTNHLDSNSRLCMSSAASGMTLSLGSDGPPACYDDIDLANAFFFIGSNAADCHPVTFQRVLRRIKKGGATCIVADPRLTATAKVATLHLALRPGTDLALLNGLLRLLRDWNQLDQSFIDANTEGWSELSALLDDYPADQVAQICGIAESALLEAARVIARSNQLLTFWTMGVNQTVQGTFTSNAIINLHLATGRIGKPGCGPFSLTGQPNAMGGRDVGYLSHLLPGQRRIADPEHRRQMEQLWGLRPGAIHDKPGHDAVAMFDALETRDLRAIWIVGTNPAASMPNLPHIRKALKCAELVIVQDAYYPTETTSFAHVILPAAVNLEQSGTFCNSERRVSLMEPVVPPPGEARPDWWWPQQVAFQMGFKSGLQFQNAAEIFDEFARVTAGRPNDQSALSHQWLAQRGPTQWPATVLGKPTRRRYIDRQFPTATGKARFWARPHLPNEESPNAQFPLVLTTGRLASQWHTRTKTGNVSQLNDLAAAPFLQINPADAAARGLKDQDRVVIQSRRGRAVSELRIDPATPAGIVFMPMHWNDLWSPESSPNEVTTDNADPISHQPALKACAVSVTPFVSILNHSADSTQIDTSGATLVILAGGRGLRMGTPKALLQIEGQPILQWLLNQLKWPGPTMLVTAPAISDPPGREHFDRHAIDPIDGIGPLRGIQTALENLSTATMVVIPVDMPLINQRQLAWLLKALAQGSEIHGMMCRPGMTGNIEPFPSVFRATAKDVIARQLATDRRSIQELCGNPLFVATEVPDDWPAETWTNLNDPESLRDFQLARRQRSYKVMQ